MAVTASSKGSSFGPCIKHLQLPAAPQPCHAHGCRETTAGARVLSLRTGRIGKGGTRSRRSSKPDTIRNSSPCMALGQRVLQKQANRARESNLNVHFTAGANWSVAKKFNGCFHLWRWNALLKAVLWQIHFCNQYLALAETACTENTEKLSVPPTLLNEIRHIPCFQSILSV